MYTLSAGVMDQSTGIIIQAKSYLGAEGVSMVLEVSPFVRGESRSEVSMVWRTIKT